VEKETLLEKKNLAEKAWHKAGDEHERHGVATAAVSATSNDGAAFGNWQEERQTP